MSCLCCGLLAAAGGQLDTIDAGSSKTAMPSDDYFMDIALAEATKGYEEGGVPIGAVLLENERVVAQGHNRRVQAGDPTAHGEMDCLRAAGRRASFRNTVLYTTLSPCMMCAGTIVQFKIPRVVIGDDINFSGNIEFLRSHGVEVVVVESRRCVELMRKFIEEKPELWKEDIAE
jgi:cytosine/creatinine deaminase